MHDPETRCFIDSNIWLYAFIESESQSADKSSQARSLVQANDATVSTQVINEVCVNLVKKANVAEADVRRAVASFYRRHTVVPLDRATLIKTSEVREQHSFSFWDSLIVASAILAGVDVLYSEDMQDGFEIGGVRIVNPFL
jgi:predicted nucleic acid-binding protein